MINVKPVSIFRTFHPVLNSGLVNYQVLLTLTSQRKGWYYKNNTIMKK
jgi:hypothetical protein